MATPAVPSTAKAKACTSERLHAFDYYHQSGMVPEAILNALRRWQDDLNIPESMLEFPTGRFYNPKTKTQETTEAAIVRKEGIIGNEIYRRCMAK